MEKTIYVKKSVAEDGMPKEEGYYFVYDRLGGGYRSLFFEGKFDSIGVEFTHYLVPVSERAVEERAIDWKAKYEKCIKIINRFDPGIISMYNL